MGSSEPVTFESTTCIAETAMAILVRFDGGNEHWVPKSVIKDESEVNEKDDTGDLVLPEWFVEKNGIE